MMLLPPDELKAALATVVPIPITPFSGAGHIDFSAYGRVLQTLLDGGVRTLTVNGNTGEFYALSPDEQRNLLSKTIETVGPKTVVLTGVGYDLETALAMTAFARGSGASGVMIHQPIHPYQSPQGWVRYHADIGQAFPELGIVPYVRDASITAEMLNALAEECPNLVGVKYAVPNPAQFAQIVRQVGRERVTWICGLAEGWAPFFWVGGARGFTSGLANVHPPLAFEMFDALEKGDYAGAMDVWARIKPFEDLRSRGNNANNVPVVKEALAQLGVCERTVRPPISELAESEREQVRAILVEWGLVRGAEGKA